MANQTVYPYGTGGSLPSSIGLVNDFHTGGADKALTAQAGKNLYDELHTITPVDLSSITAVSAFIKTSGADAGKWAVNYQSYKCKLVHVLPGELYRITGNATTYTSIAVLKSDNHAENVMADFAAGWSGVQYAGIGRTKEITIPSDGYYLYLSDYTTSDVSPQSVSKIELNTGDADLSEIMFYAIGLSQYQPINAYPGASNKWVTERPNYPYYGIFVPCDPNQTFELVGKTESSVVRYTFLQNDSHTNDSSVAFASGYSDGTASTAAGGGVVTAPGNAHYLYIVVSWDGLVTSVAPSEVKTMGNTVEEIVDAKLAEEGVEEGPIPPGLTKYDYYGAKLDFTNVARHVAKQKVATITSVSCQGGACYGDYLFLFSANNETCWIYNLSTNTLLQTYTIPSDRRGFVSNCHSNTVNFGTEKYDSDDPFPLIYVSTGYASGGYTGALVYRIVATTENDTTTYSLELVQTLKMPQSPSSWTEFVVGDDGNCFICYTNVRTIFRMKLPTLSQGDVIFDLNDALEVYKFTPQPTSWNDSSGQGRIYYKGKIIYVSGVPASGQESLLVTLDLATRTRDVVIDLKNTLGLTSEPENCFIWNGHLCIVFLQNANVYALYFD